MRPLPKVSKVNKYITVTAPASAWLVSVLMIGIRNSFLRSVERQNMQDKINEQELKIAQLNNLLNIERHEK